MKAQTRPFLILAANTPWVYALAESLTEHTAVTAIRLYDFANYRRLKPQWPETKSAVHRVSIVMPPGYASSAEVFFRPIMRGLIAREQARLRRLAGCNPFIVAPYPYLAPWVRGVQFKELIYYNLDEYPLYDPPRTKRILRQEEQLVAQAGLTVCLSEHQVQTLQERNPKFSQRIHHLPLGVVEDFLNPQPDEAPIPNSVGYVGNLSDRVDWTFVAAVASRLPEVRFHIVGSLDRKPDKDHWRQNRKRALALSNVVYEGAVSQAEVCKHYWRYAINWMPYDIGHPFNIASCPTKIMDALASGRPFLSTSIPEVRLHQKYIQIANNPEQAVTYIKTTLSAYSKHDARAQIDFAAANSWQIRGRQLIEFLR